LTIARFDAMISKSDVDLRKNIKNANKEAAQNDFIIFVVKSIRPKFFLKITGVIGSIWFGGV
jgi:hypothetical protein